MRLGLRVVLVLATIASPIRAAGPAMPVTGPVTFDIAGVRLGMDPEAARAALAKAGYRIGATNRLEGFEGQVTARIDQLRGRWHVAKYVAVASLAAAGPANEHVDVQFEQWPDAPHVVSVAFMAGADRQAQDAFKAQVEAKFGMPTMHVIGGWRWCSAGEKRCGPVANPALPTLDADYQSRALTLKVGGDAIQARRDLVEAEARKVVPLQNGSAF